jgi:hypothetical protein
MKELEIMVEKGVFLIVELSKLTSQQLRDVLPSKIFLKEKFVQKELDRLKARLVGGGHRQDRSKYSEDETSAPTISLA